MQQPKVQVDRAIWSAAFLALCMSSPRAYCQDAATEVNPQQKVPSVTENGGPLTQITVTAKVLKQRIDTYISTISGGYVRSDDHPMARWRDPVCPLVAGLPHADGQFVFDRLTDDLSATNVRLGKKGCRPNFFVVATANPDSMLKAWWHHDANLNGGQTGFVDFIGKPRPVRIWYNARLRSGDGSPPNTFVFPTYPGTGSVEAFSGGPSPQVDFVAVPDLQSVIVVVDLTRVAGLDWHQVTDYIAMAGVTKVALDAQVEGATTVMNLFSASGDARPQGLSSWDRSFIKELYTTDPVYRHQRVEIAKGMFNDVAPGSIERK